MKRIFSSSSKQMTSDFGIAGRSAGPRVSQCAGTRPAFREKPRFSIPYLRLLLGLMLLVFLAAGGGAGSSSVAHAQGVPACGAAGTTPCMLGPNLEVISLTGTLFSGTGPCVGGTSSFVASPTSPGFSATGIPTPCAAFSSTQSETFSLVAMNGYEIDGISVSGTCGVTGNNSLTLSASSSPVNSVTVTCPEESSVGATATVSNQLAFTPATNLTATITASNTSTVGGSSSLSALSWYFLLSQAIGTCTTPNPNPNPNPASFAAVGDFNGDCKSDILWRNTRPVKSICGS